MTAAIILGDVHLGKSVAIGKAGIGSNLNSRIADQLNLLDWTLEQAVERGANRIILTGDIFEDPKPHPSLIAMFIAWLKKCQAYNIYVHIILGNHDMLRSGMVFTSSLDIISEIDLDNVSIYKDINTFMIDTTAITIMPFRDRKSFNTSSNAEAVEILKESLVYELASIPVTYKKILVGHLAIEGSIPVGDEIDDIANELFCPLDMFAGYDYVWMGHVHKPQIMKKKNPFIAHIGSMDISNFVETDHQKHIVIIDCDDAAAGNNFTIEYLPTRDLRKVCITVPKDTADSTAYVLSILEKYKESKTTFDKAIVRVEISLATPELKSVNKSDIEKYLTSQGAFNVTGISESKKIALIKKDASNTIDTKMDVVTSIKEYAKTYVDAQAHDDFIELAMDLYKIYTEELKE
jgi:DNA repair exonuclease SbcCD nuclease subunit